MIHLNAPRGRPRETAPRSVKSAVFRSAVKWVACLALLPVLLLALIGCGDGGTSADTTGTSATGTSAGAAPEPTEIVLMTHDSFAVSDDVLADFTKETGVTVRVLTSGDAGAMLNQAILTKDNPLADVLYGVDNTFLSRALDAGLFEPYSPAALDRVPDQFELDPEHRVTPIDYGDICLNYDKEYFASKGLAIPSSLAELTKPEYRGLLVVENPATSSPGLAFLLATVAKFGEARRLHLEGFLERPGRERRADRLRLGRSLLLGLLRRSGGGGAPLGGLIRLLAARGSDLLRAAPG